MAEPVALVSVHDVMPQTMHAVRDIADWLDDEDIAPLTYLVVPGASWSDQQVEWLRSRQARGDQLAGHGWAHRAGPPRGIYDRLHRAFFSRGVAEHLALDESGIAALISRCFDWFAEANLEPPQLYVPPAWAMGGISRRYLNKLPFARYETLSGIYDSQTGHFDRVPLLGYEADTAFRAAFVRLSNTCNRLLAARGRLRVSIHPQDLQLNLATDLRQTIGGLQQCSLY
ncbi:MAG: polysaccharide deacetylase family protein [Gammaproteobacteria bacterium]|nr:polysaccharide deacetylase family protein [Gammaproteobacteria bacterium]NNF60666.1 DUF2334 domain-containing protein [Gammaproteobacteria bacterium]